MRDIKKLGKRAPHIAGVIAVVVFSFIAFNHLLDFAKTLEGGETKIGILLAVFAAFAVLVSVPFMPSVNMAMALMILRGPDEVWAVYAASVAGLSFAFFYGYLVPHRILHIIFADIGFHRGTALIDRFAGMNRTERLAHIYEFTPNRIRGWLTKWRYLTIAIALNFPGSVVVGGAGGILLVAGMSRLFAPLQLMLTIALVLLPIPVAISVFGIDLIEMFKSYF